MASKKIAGIRLNIDIRNALLKLACDRMVDPDLKAAADERLANVFAVLKQEVEALQPDMDVLEKYGMTVIVPEEVRLGYDDAGALTVGWPGNSKVASILEKIDDALCVQKLSNHGMKDIRVPNVVTSELGRSNPVQYLDFSKERAFKKCLPTTWDAYREYCTAHRADIDERHELVRGIQAIIQQSKTLEDVEAMWPEAKDIRKTMNVSAQIANLPSVVSDDMRGKLCQNFKKRGIDAPIVLCSAVPPTEEVNDAVERAKEDAQAAE